MSHKLILVIMPEISTLIKDITSEFVHYWNRGELDKLPTYMHPDIVIRSPYINVVYPDNKENIISGRDNVIKYWSILRDRVGVFEFELLELERVGHRVDTISSIKGNPLKMYTSFEYNEYGKIYDVTFDYKT